MSKRIAEIIAARLSLRPPQRQALTILADVLAATGIEPGRETDLAQALTVIRQDFAHVEDFERDFPSLCFALATGVGKTRLMGAFIAYLHATSRSRHFFVLAPNLTIYEKLIRDFTPNTPKYVFKGVAEFAANPPLLITGENYLDGRGVRLDRGGSGDLLAMAETVFINIFNISKIDREQSAAARKGGMPRFRRLQETMGESYFDYLAGLDDLVVLMDEAHRYRASAGAAAISGLKPLLGLELTATPKTTGAAPVAFRNVIYSYPLAQAMADGFVKEPAVATRKDFRLDDYRNREADLERIKLEDGIYHHEHVKAELETYARSVGAPRVKPFMLVVAQDTTHARRIKAVIEDDAFFNGAYRGKVIEIHSNQRGEESDEATAKLLAVEDPDESTEIVIHVNKLKEGWDVSNLYTIVPLRASASDILTEQTIGRGLRLPYGKRTGVAAVDRLTIIAHDRFQAIVDEANRPDSLIRKGLTIGEGGDIPTTKEKPFSVPSVAETRLTGATAGFAEEQAPPPILTTQAEREAARVVLGIVRQHEREPSVLRLKDADVMAAITQAARETLAVVQPSLPGMTEAVDVEKVVKAVVEEVSASTIEIPNIVLIPKSAMTFGFRDFDLTDVDRINVRPPTEAMLLQYLRTNEREMLTFSAAGVREPRPENYIIRRLIEHDDISYDDNAALLQKLASQMLARLRAYLSDETDIDNTARYHERTLADFIYAQMKEHAWQDETSFRVSISRGFSVLQPLNITAAEGTKPVQFREPPATKESVRRTVYGGFKRCCYPFQKFHSDAERRFAVLLEDEGDQVERWIKPGRRQFQIEYRSGVPYEPDFVIETKAEKILAEVKAQNEIDSDEVKDKARAAAEWCRLATSHAEKNGGKPWRYVLIPDTAIDAAASLDGLCQRFTRT